jgi:hypothetical protein
VHVGPAIDGRDRKHLERLCRYMARPPVCQERSAVTEVGRVVVRFKRAWRSGAHAVVLDPLGLAIFVCGLCFAPSAIRSRSPAHSQRWSSARWPAPSRSCRVGWELRARPGSKRSRARVGQRDWTTWVTRVARRTGRAFGLGDARRCSTPVGSVGRAREIQCDRCIGSHTARASSRTRWKLAPRQARSMPTRLRVRPQPRRERSATRANIWQSWRPHLRPGLRVPVEAVGNSNTSVLPRYPPRTHGERSKARLPTTSDRGVPSPGRCFVAPMRSSPQCAISLQASSNQRH